VFFPADDATSRIFHEWADSTAQGRESAMDSVDAQGKP